ncbi:PLP-dependent aminotransferase family protein [Cohnella algarum]|uniref:MocR-like pyridoxine biosynthesis transcription factor PdxR n=1 Tax=Cohnella algarum TaxID=2044859 RepID=UPI0019683051|nr:PLP-dependent aminotransferase family protein [Cohnella algarum]MBN2982911.1 PLP-dependent aminotransferase family protein [Cohnella algarum]
MTFQVPYELRLRECGSKHLAMYRAIRDSVASGALSPGERLPSSRTLAAMYGLSRGSVSLAYDMLAAEGYVRTGIGQGTFVCGEPKDAGFRPQGAAARPELPELSAWGRRMMAKEEAFGDESEPADPGSFVPRGMGRRSFPWAEWRAAVAAQLRRIGERAEDGGTEGSLALRQAVAARLRRERGIVCGPEQIVMTGGSMQAIALLAQLLLEEGQSAVVEDPCYPGTRLAAQAAGARVIPAAVDRQGIVPAAWDARLLFVTPTRHFPTGAVLKLERRLELLAWASKNEAWIVEDDFDSDFRWGGRPIEPLKSLDREDRVIYVGTFSRTMHREVRIGYAVLPETLREPFKRAKRLYDPYPAGFAEQLALAGWISEGGYDRHLRRMRRGFHKLQLCLAEGLRSELGELFEALPSDSGLLQFAYWKKSREEYALLYDSCKRQGVVWGDGARCAAAGPAAPPSALFGFAHLEEESIRSGLIRIRTAAETLGLIAPGKGGNDHA